MISYPYSIINTIITIYTIITYKYYNFIHVMLKMFDQKYLNNKLEIF